VSSQSNCTPSLQTSWSLMAENVAYWTVGKIGRPRCSNQVSIAEHLWFFARSIPVCGSSSSWIDFRPPQTWPIIMFCSIAPGTSLTKLLGVGEPYVHQRRHSFCHGGKVHLRLSARLACGTRAREPSALGFSTPSVFIISKQLFHATEGLGVVDLGRTWAARDIDQKKTAPFPEMSPCARPNARSHTKLRAGSRRRPD